jgi:hypothetical protein
MSLQEQKRHLRVSAMPVIAIPHNCWDCFELMPYNGVYFSVRGQIMKADKAIAHLAEKVA